MAQECIDDSPFARNDGSNPQAGKRSQKNGGEMTMNTMEIQQIMAHLPHRYPMLLIDRVLSVEAGKEIVALKKVTLNQPVFNGPLPHHPGKPRGLIVQAMAQAAPILAVKNFNIKSDNH